MKSLLFVCSLLVFNLAFTQSWKVRRPKGTFGGSAEGCDAANFGRKYSTAFFYAKIFGQTNPYADIPTFDFDGPELISNQTYDAGVGLEMVITPFKINRGVFFRTGIGAARAKHSGSYIDEKNNVRYYLDLEGGFGYAFGGYADSLLSIELNFGYQFGTKENATDVVEESVDAQGVSQNIYTTDWRYLRNAPNLGASVGLSPLKRTNLPPILSDIVLRGGVTYLMQDIPKEYRNNLTYRLTLSCPIGRN